MLPLPPGSPTTPVMTDQEQCRKECVYVLWVNNIDCGEVEDLNGSIRQTILLYVPLFIITPAGDLRRWSYMQRGVSFERQISSESYDLRSFKTRDYKLNIQSFKYDQDLGSEVQISPVSGRVVAVHSAQSPRLFLKWLII
jgi:hypothetical protein